MAAPENAYYTMLGFRPKPHRAQMLQGISKAVIIYNPTAGSARERRLRALEEAQKILRPAGIEADLWATTGPRSAT